MISKTLNMQKYNLHALHATHMKKNKMDVDVEKPSSIRVSNKTREMLAAQAIGSESHEDVILRLIKLAGTLSMEDASKIVSKGNAIGTKYQRKHKTIEVLLRGKLHFVVCTFNDLSIMSLMRTNLFRNSYIHSSSMSSLHSPNSIGYKMSPSDKAIDKSNPVDWEIELEIENVKRSDQWESPTKLEAEERRLLYFICVKRILEESFNLMLYELTTDSDFLNLDAWIDSYNRNNLSRDSLNTDIIKKMELKNH